MIAGEYPQRGRIGIAANPQNFRVQAAAAIKSFAEPRLICDEPKGCGCDGLLNTCHNRLALPALAVALPYQKVPSTLMMRNRMSC